MSFCTKQLDQENSSSQAAKTILQSTKSECNTKRLALGEVGNKIHINQVKNGTKQKDFKVSAVAPGVIKKVGTIEDRKPSVEVTANLKNTKNIVKSEAIVNSKNEKDLPKKHVIKLPTAVIEEPFSYSTKQLIDIINVDTSKNPLHNAEYGQDIYQYLVDLEKQYNIKNNFLEGHKSTPGMRAILVNWMVEIHINFKLLLETLHLSVAIVDRYLQLNKEIGREKLQLVGIVAIWIASKYEEIYWPALQDFVYICDDVFTKFQMLEMECDILKKLDFNLGKPLSLQFLRRYNQISGANLDQHTLGKYLLELILLNYKLCHVRPSLQAAAACCLAISILNDLTDPKHAWSSTLVHYTNYTYLEIKQIVLNIASILNKADTSKHQAVRVKYSSTKYSKISANTKLKGPLVKKLVTEAYFIERKVIFL